MLFRSYFVVATSSDESIEVMLKRARRAKAWGIRLKGRGEAWKWHSRDQVREVIRQRGGSDEALEQHASRIALDSEGRLASLLQDGWDVQYVHRLARYSAPARALRGLGVERDETEEMTEEELAAVNREARMHMPEWFVTSRGRTQDMVRRAASSTMASALEDVGLLGSVEDPLDRQVRLVFAQPSARHHAAFAVKGSEV